MKNGLKKVIEQIDAFMADPRALKIYPRQCFTNAKILALIIPGLAYEEGMIFTEGLQGWPIHHAWNSYRGHPIDMTAKVAGFKVSNLLSYKKITHSQLKRKARSSLFNYGPEWQDHAFWYDKDMKPIADESLRALRNSPCPDLQL